MTLPKLLTTADIAKRVGKPTWWVRRRLKKMGVAEKAGGRYETTPGQLAEMYRKLGSAVLDSELPEADEDGCPHCASLRSEVAELEAQLVELAGRLAKATRSD